MQNLLYKGCYISRLRGQTAPVGPRIGRWYGKFRTSKFRPEIAFTIHCKNQFHLPKNDGAGPKLVYEPGIKTDFEEMEHEFAIGIFRPEK